MNKYLLYFFSLVLLSEISFSDTKNWKLVDSRPEYINSEKNSSYDNLKCADSLTCMIQGSLQGWGGYYFRLTIDGGNVWKTILIDSNYFFDNWNNYFAPNINDISFPSKNLFIAAGDSGFIIRTTDLGKSWSKYKIDTNYTLIDIEMLNDKYGIIWGGTLDTNKYSKLWETKDGGDTWSEIHYISLPYIRCDPPVLMIDTNIIYLSGDIIDSTTKKHHHFLLNKFRDNFTIHDTVSSPGRTGMKFIDENNGWICFYTANKGTGGGLYFRQYIYHTTNGGNTWETQWDSLGNKAEVSGLDFFDENFGMVCGRYSFMLTTTNGGRTWNCDSTEYNVPNGLSFIMSSVQVVSNQTAYVIGANRYIYKYTREWQTDVGEDKKLKDISVSPNPATDYISISISNSRIEKVEIYDILGILYTPPNPLLIEGEQLRLDVSGFVPGVYFVKVGDKVQRFVKM